MSDRSIDPAIVFVAIIVVLIIGVGVFIFSQLRTDEIAVKTDAGELIPILFVVTNDDAPILSHVLLIQPDTKRIGLVDIPENLGSIISSLGRVDGLNVLYRAKGILEYKALIEQMLDQKLPYYIVLDRNQATTVVDLLNGLPMFIADSLDISDNGNKVRIPNGNIELDGEKALDLIAYHSESERDQERFNRRWAFIKAFISRLGTAPVNQGRFMQLIMRQFTTNLDERAIVSLASVFSSVDVNTIINQRIIGNTRIVETEEGAKSLLFPHFEGRLLKDSLRQVVTTLASVEDPKENTGLIRLEILNGTPQSGLARRTKDLFQSYGFEVVSLGNAASSGIASTQVIDRKGNPALAEKAAGIIRCEKIITQIEAGTNQDIDVTIILGKDFDGWFVKNG